MAFKDAHTQFKIIDVTLIEPDPASPRRHIDDVSLKSLSNSIRKKGLIQPLLVQSAGDSGRHTLIVGERRWRAAVMAGEKTVPALICSCDPDEALELQVFENMGLGMRVALDPRDMANAIQTIAERFDTRDAAADHFGGMPSWLNQATAAAAANLSPKITALLDSGRISSTGAAVQLEKLVQKNDVKAESLIGEAEQMPEGGKLTRKAVDRALAEEGGRRKKKDQVTPDAVALALTTAAVGNAAYLPPWEEAPVAKLSNSRISPGKMKMVAEILGMTDGNEEDIFALLVDEFLAMKREG